MIVMEALKSSCSSSSSLKFISENCGSRELCSSGNVCVSRPPSFWIPVKKYDRVGLLRLFHARYRFLNPICSSSPSMVSQADSQVNSVSEEAPIKEEKPPKTVQVKFQLQKQCLFGEHFFVVGEISVLGLWDPENAVPLVWSEGHVWSIELEIPAEQSIQFKYVLKDIRGNIVWQPGPDRVVKTNETNDIITVSGGWEYIEILDESFVDEDKEESDLQTEESHLRESNHASQNFSLIEKRIEVNRSSDARDEKLIKPLNERKEEGLGSEDFHEGTPVLVPGLPPLPVVEAVKEIREVAEKPSISETLSETVKNIPELDQRQELEGQIDSKEATTVTFIESKLSNVNGVQHAHDYDLSKEAGFVAAAATKKEEEQDERGSEENEQKEGNLHHEFITHPGGDVLRNDIQWSRRALHKLLGGFRLI